MIKGGFFDLTIILSMMGMPKNFMKMLLCYNSTINGILVPFPLETAYSEFASPLLSF